MAHPGVGNEIWNSVLRESGDCKSALSDLRQSAAGFYEPSKAPVKGDGIVLLNRDNGQNNHEQNARITTGDFFRDPLPTDKPQYGLTPPPPCDCGKTVLPIKTDEALPLLPDHADGVYGFDPVTGKIS